MIRYAREIAKRVDPELPKLFRVLPRMPYGVKPIPEYMAATSASHYLSPALDGTRAGMFFMRTYEAEKQPRFRTEALVLHETVPGHHLQRALQMEMQDVPKLRTLMGYSAYSEGWGLYAESLGEDLGVVYQTPHTLYGKLHSELFRACRLVVGLAPKSETNRLDSKSIERRMSDEFVSTEIHARVQVVGGGTAAAGRLGGRGQPGL